jgi:hypothetical protein
LPNAFVEEIGQDLHLGRHRSRRRRPDEIEPALRAWVICQERNEIAGEKPWPNQERRQHRDAEAGCDSVEQSLPIVGHEVARRSEGDDVCAVAKSPRLVGMNERAMSPNVIQGLRRPVLRDIGRTGNDSCPDWRDARGKQRRIRHGSDADADIETLADEVDEPIAVERMDLHPGMALAELRQDWRKVRLSEREGRCDPERSRRLVTVRDGVASRSHLGNHALGIGLKIRTLLRQKNASRGAHQERNAEHLFKS